MTDTWYLITAVEWDSHQGRLPIHFHFTQESNLGPLDIEGQALTTALQNLCVCTRNLPFKHHTTHFVLARDLDWSGPSSLDLSRTAPSLSKITTITHWKNMKTHERCDKSVKVTVTEHFSKDGEGEKTYGRIMHLNWIKTEEDKIIKVTSL